MASECHYCHKPIVRPTSYTCTDNEGRLYCTKSHRTFALSGKPRQQSGYHALKLRTEEQEQTLKQVDCLVHLMAKDPQCSGWVQRFERVLH